MSFRLRLGLPFLCGCPLLGKQALKPSENGRAWFSDGFNAVFA
ncbi:hypothetical protein HMPREF9120_01330 [Neisseria sp. oral taxon 020 str. F0370]|nr:hypothetical protein HMPREF9120_01330 [Neisseria sp. oral taxon 020 str. F0370]